VIFSFTSGTTILGLNLFIHLLEKIILETKSFLNNMSLGILNVWKVQRAATHGHVNTYKIRFSL